MAKTAYQIKKALGITNGLRAKKRLETTEELKADIKAGKYKSSFGLIKSELEKTINFDTFESDLSSVGKTILDNANNWQTQETMLNTRASIESMKDRIGSYKEYMRLFGNKETADIKGIEKIHNSYRDVLDEWDARSKLYGQYENADAFNVGKKILLLDNEYAGLTFDEVQAKKKEFAEDSFEYKYFDNYTKYTDLNEFDKAIQGLKNKKSDSNDRSSYGRKLDNTNKTLQMKPLGTDLTEGLRNPEAEEALRKSAEEAINSPNKESYYEKIAFEGKDLETERNKWKLDHAFDLYKDVMQNEDFAETSKYVSTKGNYDNLWDKLNKGQYGLGYGDLTYEYINNVDGIRNEIDSKANIYSKDSPNPFDSGNSSMKDKGYHKLNPDEVSVYNSLYKYDKENGTNRAQKFLDDMEITLSKRVYYDEMTKTWKANSESFVGGAINSILSVPASVYGAIPTLVDGAKDFLQGKEYNPYSANKTLTNFAQDTRKYVGENIEEATEGMEVFGQNIPSFLYSTGMSMADSFLGATTLGSAYLPLAGTSAFHQKAKELTEAGEDSATIYKTALASGAAEMIFEKISLDKFLKIKNVDDKVRIVKNTLVQAGIEGSEELATEISNIITDSAIRGENSELSQYRLQLLKSGLTEKEADIEVAKRIGSQVTWAGIGGALSGAGMGFAGSVGNYAENKSTGNMVKGNERVQDLFDIANNPDMASAYETYTRYANKEINADNVTNAQLGRLYNEAYAESKEIYNSKKSTDEQKANALKNLYRLSEIRTPNKEKIAEKERKQAIDKHTKDFHIGDKTMVTESGESVNVKDFRIEGDKVTVNTKNGEVGVDDITLNNNDSAIIGYAKEIANNDGDELANLFISQYDGKSDIDAYANSFNLTIEYSKSNMSYDYILNSSRTLTGAQVSEIYEKTRIKAIKEKQERIDKLNKDMADGKFYKGFINESAIDYDNTSAEGKINWKDITTKQRQAIVFIKGIAQATGMNLVFSANSEDFNGKYDKDTNVLTINIDNVTNGVLEKAVDNIIPAMSHETTHWMKDKAPEMWNHLNDIVFSTLVEHYNSNPKEASALLFGLGKYGDTITEKDLIDREVKRLKEKKYEGKEVNEEALKDEAREEIIARACEDLLKMSKQGRKIFNSLSESEQKTLGEKIKGLINDLLTWVDSLLNSYDAKSREAQIMKLYQDKLNEASKVWDAMLEQSVKANQSLEKSGAYNHVVESFNSIGSRDLNELAKAKNIDGTGLFQYKAMVEDEDTYREMLIKHKDIIGITNQQINALFTMVDNAVDIISENLEALDYAWDEDINDRAFHPVKQNSDKLYKVSLDFSTLCRKRLLQQTIQAQLQSALNKQLSTEEAIAIRDELMKIQEEGRKIEVACALCYVESARMKSPEQIKRFLNDRESVIREFFANRSGGTIKEKIKSAEMKAREKLAKANPNGLIGKNGTKLNPLDAKLSHMSKSDADSIRTEKKKAKASYELTEHEQAELDVAMNMSISDFTSAKGLENLAKNHSDLFDAYTSYIRNATHSKGLENDVWWRAGDSNAIGDTLIEQMNAENGLRSQSWSDFQVIHLLDYIAATIELSTKKVKRQSYTKVPDYVKLLGNTGDMINMSVIPERVFDGKLGYDDVEGMAYKVACELRETYHETAGIICIGIDNDQIRLLLEDATIDMVIPYHKSSMAKERRKLMHIPDWKDFEAYQNETTKLTEAEAKARAKEYGVKLLPSTDVNYQKSPKFSEWFNLQEARQIAKMENENPTDMKAYKKYGKMYGGYMAMQNAANNYLKLCAERSLLPKFAHEKADFSKEANYWKLLIDRKMVDNVTGEIIEQKPIKPIFNEKNVLEILNDELARYPQIKADQEYASRKVTEKFLSGKMKVDESTLEAIKKPIDNVTGVNILESSQARQVLYDESDSVTETITFNSEQAKLTSNLNPTENEDIRFSMKETVEETKDLIAVHNVSPSKLLKTLKLGGLPMPSIAITRAREGYNNFGDISLVFGKETIDPQFMRSNKVYSGDAWTPTYPQVEYKLNTKAQERIKKKIDALVPSNVQSDLGGTHLDSTNMEYELNRHGDMVTSYRYNYAMKYAFLKDNNVDIELPTKEEPFYRYGEVSNSAVISFAYKMVDGLKSVNSLLEQHSSKLMADTDLLNAIASALNEEIMSTVEENTEEYQKLIDNPVFKPEDIDLDTVLGMLEAARKYYHSNGKIDSKIDYREARTLIDDNTDMPKYEAWLKSLFSDVIAKEGIRNNKDLFTPSGNRRSFEALHYEHTLENVIKAMKEEGAKGIGGFGGGNLFGASTREYGSIDEIKADATNRMKLLGESKYDEIKKGFSDRLYELANSLPIHKDSFSALDDAANMLIEAVLKFKTKSGMANYLRTESKGWANYSDYIVDDLVELVNDIRSMPVAYFEAKPQRAVGFDEIKAVIMPSQESYEDDLSEVKSELEKHNIPILEYIWGDNNDRAKALNSLEEVRFSDKDTEYLELAKDPVKNEARLREMVENVAKANGFNTKVYHGTAKFGFTKTDVRKSDDGISFFATDSLDLAQTYSGTVGETKLKKGARQNTEIEQIYKDRLDAFIDKVNSVAGKEILKANELPFDDYARKIKKGKMDGSQLWSEMTNYTFEVIEKIEAEKRVSVEDDNSIWKLSTELETALYGFNGNAGNYGLYANTDGFLEIEGNGARWSSIPFDKIPSKSTANTREIVKWAKDNGYNGVLFKNIYDIGNNGSTQKSPANVYAFLKPKEQLKSADTVTYDALGRIIPLEKRFNTDNNDLRYSDKDESVYDIMGETERIIKENEKLKEDVERLKERLEIERKVTHGNHFNENHLGAVAGHLRNISKSNMDKFELMKALKDVYSFIAHSENLTWKEVFEKCYNVASDIVAEAKPEVEVNDYFKEILKDIRDKKISLSDTQKSEARYIFGKNWNRNFFGRTTITDNGISLESQWQEWSELYPTIFKANISDADMPGKLYDIINNLQDASEMVKEFDVVEETRRMAREIYNQYWNVSPIRTTADKYDKQIKRLNFEHRKAMSEFRNEYNERLEGQKLADDIYYGRKMHELKEKDKAKYNERLKAQREKQREKQIELYKKFREERQRAVAYAKQNLRDDIKERADRKTLMQSIMATTTSLNKKLIKNDKDVHIPETLKPVVINLINAIDFSSKQLLGMDGSRKDRRGTPTQNDIALDNTFGRVKSMADDSVTLKQSIQDALELFENAEKVANNTSDGTWDLSIVALDIDLIDRIKSLIKSLDVLEKNYGTKFTLQQMETDHLKTLNATVKSISVWANNVDHALSMKHKERISVSGEETCEENDVLGKRKQYIESVESFKNFFSWSNLTPVNAFKRLGKAAMKYFDSLRDAQDDLTFYQEEIIRFTDKLFEGKLKDIRKWREEVKEFDLTLPNGKSKTVRMPVSYVMSLYCVAKQEDAQRHLYGMDENGNRYDNNGGGMTIAPFKEKKSIEVSEDIENTIMTESLVKKITGTLTEEQRHIADELQKFMNTKGSEWCDAVSVALYGIKKFDIENYFPITVSPNTIKVLNPQDKRQSIHFFSILNYGFTKSRNPNAKQSIEIGDIFDIFANHMSMAAIYSAYALPIYDVVRWYNYKGKNAEGKEIGVITSIQKAFGKSATTYIGRLISDLNGQHEASRLGFVTKIFKNTKLAMVGNSISVALLQPTAYLKAMTKIPVRYLLKSALYVKDFGAKKGVEKAKKWCGIALWKSRNNFDTDISKSVTSEMLHDEKWHEKLKEWSLKGASKLDEKTWGVLWNACEFDVRANRKDLKVGSDEFYEEIAYRLRDVIYETQVVDSPLTRSDIMRSPDNLAKMLTMFGSEMTVAYNMVSEAFVDAKLYTKRNGKKGAFKRNAKSIGIALTAYTLTSAASQILNTMVQVLRDDEDKEPEEIMKMYFSNFFADWLIFGKIPYIKEFLNYAQGYSASRPDTLWLDSTVKSVKYWAKAFEGKEGTGEKAIKESLKALSYLSGVPGYNQYRDLMATLDKLGILTAEDFSEMIDDLFD